MEEFELEGGLKPVKRPKLTDFCSKCRLEVPRAVKICPRCGFDIEAFRMFEMPAPVPKPAAAATRAPRPSPVVVASAAVGLLVVAAAIWWVRSRSAEPAVAPRPVARREPAGWSPALALPTATPLPGSEWSEPSRVPEEVPKEVRGSAVTAPVRETPILGRVKPASAAASAPGTHKIILTDGTVYEAVSMQGAGSMVTLRLTDKRVVVVYRSDIDEGKTRAANPDPAGSR